MTRPKRRNPGPALSPDSAVEATVYCKLFSDRVSEKLCFLRKKELNRREGFSCEGCPMDAIIAQRLKLVVDVLGLKRDPV